MTRHASCSCGQLKVVCEGEPVRISMCHCNACQQRTGSVFGVQARFPREQVRIDGKATRFARKADSGNTLTYGFCPECGSTMFWEGTGFSGLIAVSVGNFADPGFPAPRISVWEGKRHPWAMAPGALTMEHQPAG
jgi:hypothetical protein